MNSALTNRVKEAAKYYNYSGPIEPGMVHLLAEEGFSAANYDDDVGIDTQGVGQTAENKGKNFFTETYPKYVARAQKKVKGYETLPQEVQNAVLSGVYRGDLGPDTAKLLSERRFKEAADEYLDHDEYKARKEADPKDGVVLRMKRNSDAMAGADNGERGLEPAPMAGGSDKRPSPIQSDSGGKAVRQDSLRGGHLDLSGVKW
jgi:GH24 family phage-related lysozyme (muramidase)